MRIALILIGWLFVIAGIIHKDINTIGIGFLFFAIDVLYSKEKS